jgi:GT2 family glycosyltransferase
MADRPKIGVVTVTYNSADVLPEFLRCIETQTYSDLLLFVVDNASSDETLQVLRSAADRRLRIIVNATNTGVAEGNNQGIEAALEAGCDLVLLLNNDTAFGDELLQQLVDGLDHYKCDMICPKIVYFDHPERIWAAGGTFQPLLGYRTRHFGEGKIDRGQYDRVRQVSYSSTCCVLVRSEVFASVGKMDARYFVYVDDVDFMYRAMKAGKKLIYLPKSTLRHKVGCLTGGKESSFSIKYGTRNRVYFLLKNVGLLRSLPALMLYQAYYFGSLLSFRFSVEKYRMKQRAFMDGFSMGRRQ